MKNNKPTTPKTHLKIQTVNLKDMDLQVSQVPIKPKTWELLQILHGEADEKETIKALFELLQLGCSLAKSLEVLESAFDSGNIQILGKGEDDKRIIQHLARAIMGQEIES